MWTQLGGRKPNAIGLPTAGSERTTERGFQVEGASILHSSKVLWEGESRLKTTSDVQDFERVTCLEKLLKETPHKDGKQTKPTRDLGPRNPGIQPAERQKELVGDRKGHSRWTARPGPGG